MRPPVTGGSTWAARCPAAGSAPASPPRGGSSPSTRRPSNAQEGQQLQIAVSATGGQAGRLSYWADNLPAGAAFDPVQDVLTWTPGFGQAGTYTNVRFTVSDGVNRVSETTTLLIAPSPPV